MPRQREKQSLKKIRVLIVDDHTLIRDGICALLALVSDVEVVGEASNGKEALEKVKDLYPDVVLMDLTMPVMGGLEATRRIRKEFPTVKVLVMTQYDDSDYVIPVIEAGARGFITKMSAFSELSSAIQSVYSGESFLSPSAAMVLIEEQQRKKSDGGEEKDPYQGLTDREREVLKLIVENHTVREIADILFLSPKTVEWYKTKLMGKLNIHNKTDLIRFAIRKKIITL
jgi:two-component system response regulator NreC